MKTEQLVQEIHDSFNTASDKLLIEAKQTLESLKGQISTHEEQDVADRMRKLGFTGTQTSKRVRRHEEAQAAVIKTRQEMEDLAKLVVEKSMIDPVHKFITEKQVKKICEKYGLIHGPADKYIGDIPLKNLEQMENFKPNEDEIEAQCSIFLADDKDAYYHSIYKKIHNKDGVSEDRDKHISLMGWNKSLFTMSLGTVKKLDIEKDVVVKEAFSICAPEKDFDKEGMDIKGYKLFKKPIPDPVVLYGVIGGYRIVTAWGPEASDPDVVNPLSN